MSHSHRVSEVRVGVSLAVGLALLTLIGPVATAQERESPPSRPLPVETRAPSPPPTPSPPPSPPPSTPGGGTPSTRPGGGGHHSGGHYYYPRRHHGYWGYGHYWPYSRFYWGYAMPYYPWGLVWYPAYASDTRLGALDLKVKPRRVEVWVDGQYVNTAGKLDGYPGYLWLSEGMHEVVFYREGWQTVKRKMLVRPGPIRKLRLELAKGASTPPEELFEPPSKTAEVERRARPGDRQERPPQVDLRGEPGRFRLEVEPADASIYLDGRFVGTGEQLSKLHSGMMVDPGEHVLDVQRPGYETERISFSVAPGDEADLRVDLDSSEVSRD